MIYNKPIELFTILGEVVDSMRQTNTITSFTEVNGLYTLISDNTLSNSDYITIDFLQFKIKNVTETQFQIKYTTGTDFLNKIWKANAPYFMHEKEAKAGEVLTEKTKQDTYKYQKYPLFLLVRPYTDSRDNQMIGYSADFNLYIITNTEQTYWSNDRVNKNFEPTLYPLYEDFINKLIEHRYIKEKFADKLNHSKTDLMFIDGNPFPDKMDGLNISFTGLEVLKPARVCEPITPKQYSLTLDSDANGSVQPFEGTQLKNVNETIAINATPNENYSFKQWLINGIESVVNPTWVKMTNNITAIAEFFRTFTLNISSVGNGSTIPSTGSYEIEEGETVQIEAIPDENNQFVNFDDDGTIITDNPYHLVMDSIKNVVANFILSGGFSDYYQWLPLGEDNDLINKGTGLSPVDGLLVSGSMATQDIVFDWIRGDAGLQAVADAYGINNPMSYDGLELLKAYPKYPVQPRNNTVGRIAVEKDVYITNTNETTYTVGVAGDYLTINEAINVAVAGDVIELLDDDIILTERITITTGLDANNMPLKIKGKTTKTALTLDDGNIIAIYLAEQGYSVELENITIKEPTAGNTYIIYAPANNYTSTVHFINCNIEHDGYIYIVNPYELIMDGVVFDGVDVSEAVRLGSTSLVQNDSKVIFNNIYYRSIRSGNRFISTSGIEYYPNYISITNSDIKSVREPVFLTGIKSVRIEGNRLEGLERAAVYLGYEVVDGVTIGDFSIWDNTTNYQVGAIVSNSFILYECVIANSDSEPYRKTNTNWKIFEETTGVIRNNLSSGVTYIRGHGYFIGHGAYGMLIENNIVDNYTFNIVVKGHDNTIQYNCTGRGINGGLFIVSNDQTIVRNNTLMTGLQYGPQGQGLGAEGPVNTRFEYNIINGLLDYYTRWVNPPLINNVFIGNSYLGTCDFEVTKYVMPTELTAFLAEVNDTIGVSLSLDIIETDPTKEEYYKPINVDYFKYVDNFGHNLGAVDLDSIPKNDFTLTEKDGVFTDWAVQPYANYQVLEGDFETTDGEYPVIKDF